MAVEKTINIVWRNENYGRITDAQSFRFEKEPYPSDTEHTRLARLFRKHGFTINQQRDCWMAEFAPEDACVRLVGALEELGYVVHNRGAMPDALQSAAPAP